MLVGARIAPEQKEDDVKIHVWNGFPTESLSVWELSGSHQVDVVDRDTFPEDAMVFVAAENVPDLVMVINDSRRIGRLIAKSKRLVLWVGLAALYPNHWAGSVWESFAAVVTGAEALAEALCPRQLSDDWRSLIEKATLPSLVPGRKLDAYGLDEVIGLPSEPLAHAKSCSACGSAAKSALLSALLARARQMVSGNIHFHSVSDLGGLEEIIHHLFGPDPGSGRRPGRA